MLAFMSDERAAQYLTGDIPEPRTPNTIRSVAALKRELAGVRARGFAIDNEENERDICCVGAPVFDASAEVIGGLSVSAPVFDLSREEAEALGPTVVAAAHRVSLAMGAPAEALPEVSASVLDAEHGHSVTSLSSS
jgi:DNA-binding IclR family transcriptional regulator